MQDVAERELQAGDFVVYTPKVSNWGGLSFGFVVDGGVVTGGRKKQVYQDQVLGVDPSMIPQKTLDRLIEQMKKRGVTPRI